MFITSGECGARAEEKYPLTVGLVGQMATDVFIAVCVRVRAVAPAKIIDPLAGIGVAVWERVGTRAVMPMTEIFRLAKRQTRLRIRALCNDGHQSQDKNQDRSHGTPFPRRSLVSGIGSGSEN